MSHELVTTTRYDDGAASETLSRKVDVFAQQHKLGETEVVLEGARHRIGEAEHTLDAIEGFSDDPAGELTEMIAEAKATGEQAAVGQADRVVELAIVDGQDNNKVLAHELNDQLDEGEPGVIDALQDLEMTDPAKLSELTASLDAEIYFHGSNYPYKIGDKIHPGDGAVLGENGELNASATTDERTAWAYALDKENGPYGYRSAESGVNLRGRVYEVVPPDGKPAKRLGPQIGEINSPAFTVVGYRDALPGRQGTIPEINWKEYSPKSSNANHITEDPLFTESDYKEPHQRDSDDIPLPGLGDDYVRAEKERIRKKSGLPLM